MTYWSGENTYFNLSNQGYKYCAHSFFSVNFGDCSSHSFRAHSHHAKCSHRPKNWSDIIKFEMLRTLPFSVFLSLTTKSSSLSRFLFFFNLLLRHTFFKGMTGKCRPSAYCTTFTSLTREFHHITTGFCKTEFFLHNQSPNLFWWTRKKKKKFLTGHTGWFCGPYCSDLKVITILLKYLATVPNSHQLQELFLFFDQTIPKHENETSHTDLLYAHQVETKRSYAKIK